MSVWKSSEKRLIIKHLTQCYITRCRDETPRSSSKILCTARHIFNSLLTVSSGDETLSHA